MEKQARPNKMTQEISMNANAPSPYTGLINTLRSKIETTLSDWIVPEGRSFAILDFPHHNNIGDSAIYVGQMSYLRKRNLFPAYVAPISKFDAEEMASAIGDGPIYIHGGGNLGDLWPWFQNFKEQILEQYKGREIVQFPQSIHFSSQKNIDEMARKIEGHGNYKLLVRDEPSFELAKKSFQCDVRLCPDMAFCIPPIARPNPAYEILLHLLEDQEAKTSYDTAALLKHAGILQRDWPNEGKQKKLALYAQSFAQSFFSDNGFRGRNKLIASFYAQLATLRFFRGVGILGQAKCVVTDRLHGHIMCTLLGIPHAVLDNSYGKISRFMAAWGTGVDHTYPVTTLNEAIHILCEKERLNLDISKAEFPTAA